MISLKPLCQKRIFIHCLHYLFDLFFNRALRDCLFWSLYWSFFRSIFCNSFFRFNYFLLFVLWFEEIIQGLDRRNQFLSVFNSCLFSSLFTSLQLLHTLLLLFVWYLLLPSPTRLCELPFLIRLQQIWWWDYVFVLFVKCSHLFLYSKKIFYFLLNVKYKVVDGLVQSSSRHSIGRCCIECSCNYKQDSRDSRQIRSCGFKSIRLAKYK